MGDDLTIIEIRLTEQAHSPNFLAILCIVRDSMQSADVKASRMSSARYCDMVEAKSRSRQVGGQAHDGGNQTS